MRLSSVRAPGTCGRRVASLVLGAWHSRRRRSSPQNAHLVSSRTVFTDTCRMPALGTRQSTSRVVVVYCAGTCRVLCGLRCDCDNEPFTCHHRYTAITRPRRSSSECGDMPSALRCFPRPVRRSARRAGGPTRTTRQPHPVERNQLPQGSSSHGSDAQALIRHAAYGRFPPTHVVSPMGTCSTFIAWKSLGDAPCF